MRVVAMRAVAMRGVAMRAVPVPSAGALEAAAQIRLIVRLRRLASMRMHISVLVCLRNTRKSSDDGNANEDAQAQWTTLLDLLADVARGGALFHVVGCRLQCFDSAALGRRRRI